jgi:hypothetical protein
MIFDRALTLLGVIDKITSLIWTRRYWACGEFKLLVPFTARHVELLQKYRLIMIRGDDEAGEIQYLNIKKNSQGLEEIEVQGRFITCWIGKRIVLNQIVMTGKTQDILNRIVYENIVNPDIPGRRIPNITIPGVTGITREDIDYASGMYANALLVCETAAKASKLGFGIFTDIKKRQHIFRVYDGLNLTAEQTENPPCIFSQEFDNIIEQEYTNSIENLRSTVYVGGEESPDAPRHIVEVGDTAAGLDRDEAFINATDITQTYKDSAGNDVTMSDTQYRYMLMQRGSSELEQLAETLSFASKVNTHSNLKYRDDYNLGDRVTCINKQWGIRINVRITEITEIYQSGSGEINITFGESLPSLFDALRQIK